jgi:hypothetical protein
LGCGVNKAKKRAKRPLKIAWLTLPKALRRRGEWGNASKLLSGFSGMKLQKTSRTAVGSMHVYDVRPREDPRGFDLISDALPFGRLWYVEPDAINNAVGYVSAKFTFSHSRVRTSG